MKLAWSIYTRRILSIILISVFLLFTSGCSDNGQTENEPLSVKAVTSELKVVPSNSKVEDFLNINKDFSSGYENDVCFNITPDFITDNSSYSIFKYSSSTSSFLMFENETFKLGEHFGGYGVTSMALADLDKDYQYEFYFTFSWGSGLHRSQIGYFDPVAREVMIFDYSHLNKDMMLTTNEDGDLLVNEVSIKINTFVDFTVKADKPIGSITFNNDTITLDISDAD